MTSISSAPKLTRRTMVKATAAAGGGLILSVSIPRLNAALAAESNADFAPNAFVRIDPDGKVTFTIPQVEMGQGIYTALSMILAEELDAPFEHVTAVAAPPNDKLYGEPASRVPGDRRLDLGPRLLEADANRRRDRPRHAGASRRGEVERRSGVLPDGKRRSSSRRERPKGRLWRACAGGRALTPPQNPPLKPATDFKLIGKSLKRLDTPDKVNGKAVYGIDALPSGVKIATLASCPVFGGKVAHVNDERAKTVPGVRQVIVLDDLVAVVGDHMWAAKKGLNALDITWDEGPNAEMSTADVLNGLVAASEKEGAVAKSTGDVDKALGEETKLEATYHVPFLAHAPMEPMNCTVHVRPDACEIWVGNQVITRAQGIAAKLTGLPPEKVIVHNHLIGGGFGRRLEVDYIAKAVRIAQKVDGPVKVIWTREEDIQQALYRPFYFDRFQATLSGGKITAWSHKIAGSSVLARWAPPAFKDGIDGDAVDGAIDFPYDTPNLHVEYVHAEPPAVPTCFWRSVGPGHNIFVIESFVDELAHAAGQDPVAFRRAHLAKEPRLLACLNLAAEKAGWGGALPARVGRGVACQSVFGSYVAAIAEAEVDNSGEIAIRRVTAAVDCGTIVNPDSVEAQIQGGLIFGLTAALYNEITIAKGRVQQSNFNNYRMMRINETPAIEVHLVRNGESPGGLGEPGTSIAAPALANALFAATGVRLRSLPIDRKQLAQRKAA